MPTKTHKHKYILMGLKSCGKKMKKMMIMEWNGNLRVLLPVAVGNVLVLLIGLRFFLRTGLARPVRLVGLFGLGAIQSHGFWLWLWLRRNKRRTFEKELLCCVLIRFEVLGILTLYFAKPLHTVFLFVLSLRGTSDK